MLKITLLKRKIDFLGVSIIVASTVYKQKITIFAGLGKILNIVKWGNYELARKRLEKIFLESFIMRDG